MKRPPASSRAGEVEVRDGDVGRWIRARAGGRVATPAEHAPPAAVHPVNALAVRPTYTRAIKIAYSALSCVLITQIPYNYRKEQESQGMTLRPSYSPTGCGEGNGRGLRPRAAAAEGVAVRGHGQDVDLGCIWRHWHKF